MKDRSDVDVALTRKRFYFINEVVEWQLTQYIWTGCTSLKLRDAVMEHATELIRQLIRKQGLHRIYPGQDDSAFGDLLQTGWVQVERSLYKYRASPYCRRCYNPERPAKSILYSPQDFEYGIKTFEEVIEMHGGVCPHCGGELKSSPMIEPEQGRYGGSESILYRGASKVFNMWSQVVRMSVLAHIKKDRRDNRNTDFYKEHLSGKSQGVSDMMLRFFAEAREMCQYSEEHLQILDALERLMCEDDKPHDAIIAKLTKESGLPRKSVTGFLKTVKLRSFEFSDSPLSRSARSEAVSCKQDVEFEDE